MNQLVLDFNRRNVRGEVIVGRGAVLKMPAVIDYPDPLCPQACFLIADPSRWPLAADERVCVVDADGNRCTGVLRHDETRTTRHRWSVALDWSTWQDAPSPTTATT